MRITAILLSMCVLVGCNQGKKLLRNKNALTAATIDATRTNSTPTPTATTNQTPKVTATPTSTATTQTNADSITCAHFEFKDGQYAMNNPITSCDPVNNDICEVVSCAGTLYGGGGQYVALLEKSSETSKTTIYGLADCNMDQAINFCAVNMGYWPEGVIAFRSAKKKEGAVQVTITTPSDSCKEATRKNKENFTDTSVFAGITEANGWGLTCQDFSYTITACDLQMPAPASSSITAAPRGLNDCVDNNAAYLCGDACVVLGNSGVLKTTCCKEVLTQKTTAMPNMDPSVVPTNQTDDFLTKPVDTTSNCGEVKRINAGDLVPVASNSNAVKKYDQSGYWGIQCADGFEPYAGRGANTSILGDLNGGNLITNDGHCQVNYNGSVQGWSIYNEAANCRANYVPTGELQLSMDLACCKKP